MEQNELNNKLDASLDNKFEEQASNEVNEKKEKKDLTGLKITAAVTGGVIAAGLAVHTLMPNVTDTLVNLVEDALYDNTGLSFNFNDDFNPGGEAFIAYYGIVEPEYSTEGVEGFK